MKKFILISLHLLIALLVWQCSSETPVSGTHIEGDITGASNLQINLDRTSPGVANLGVANTKADVNGHFEFDFPEKLDPGMYALRIGQRRIPVILDNEPAHISITGDMNNIHTFGYTVQGSRSSKAVADMGKRLTSGKTTIEEVALFADTVQNPISGAYIAINALGNQPDGVSVLKKTHERLTNQYPNLDLTQSMGQYVDAVSANQPRGSITVGQPAPDIKLTSPDGKTFALSDLKGQVVLLDFWASWCGPCRRENPNVVKIYNKYKDQGFTVYSVSLDGLDSRTKQRLGNDATRIAEAEENSKKRWVSAIQKDGLSWAYHVSDLKKWESNAARTYGVRSIPRAFMIDREGNIAATNLRGAESIERELKPLL